MIHLGVDRKSRTAASHLPEVSLICHQNKTLHSSVSINNVTVKTGVFLFQTVFINLPHLCHEVVFIKRFSHKNDGCDVQADLPFFSLKETAGSRPAVINWIDVAILTLFSSRSSWALQTFLDLLPRRKMGACLALGTLSSCVSLRSPALPSTALMCCYFLSDLTTFRL